MLRRQTKEKAKCTRQEASLPRSQRYGARLNRMPMSMSMSRSISIDKVKVSVRDYAQSQLSRLLTTIPLLRLQSNLPRLQQKRPNKADTKSSKESKRRQIFGPGLDPKPRPG